MHSKAAAEELSIEGCVGSWLQFWFETDLEVSSINPFLLSNLQKENSRWSSSRAAVLPAASSGLPSQEVWCYGCQQLSTTLLLSFFVCASCHLQCYGQQHAYTHQLSKIVFVCSKFQMLFWQFW